MTPSENFRLMAGYNRWMNERLYTLCATLSDEERTTLLSQLGIDPGVTDLIAYYRERA
ncbi:MAG TPA: hypothetical protein VLF14_03105 [Candidatus Binatia bacterium]|nr:hypothetical protein [Candidatus Binatia bacterium]